MKNHGEVRRLAQKLNGELPEVYRDNRVPANGDIVHARVIRNGSTIIIKAWMDDYLDIHKKRLCTLNDYKKICQQEVSAEQHTKEIQAVHALMNVGNICPSCGVLHKTQAHKSNCVLYGMISNDTEEKEWRGWEDGLPPEGKKCEYNRSILLAETDYVPGEIVAHVRSGGKDIAVLQADDNFYMGTADKFRPIPTDRERWVEQAAQHVDSMGFASDQLKKIHDALLNGDLPVPGKGGE